LVVAFSCAYIAHSAPLFQQIPSTESGLAFRNEFEEDGARSYLYQSGFSCGAIAIGDVNGDQKPDILFTGGTGPNALYLNKGALKFEPAPLTCGDHWASGAALIDIDNDGDLDIHICNYAEPNQLFLNDGTGKFTDKTAESGLGISGPSFNATFADFDQDGDLDLFLLNNKLFLPKGRPPKPPYRMVNGRPVVIDEFAPFLMLTETTPGKFSIDDYGHPDRLLLNDGLQKNGVPKFRDITAESGIKGIGHGLSATLIDIDSDGLLDIYVANDFATPDRLWKNQGTDTSGIPTFTDEIATFLPQIPWSSMGAAASDLDNDGRIDLMVVDMSATTHFKAKISMGDMQGSLRDVLENGWPRQSMRNHLFWDTGVGHYQESAFFSGVASTDWSWAVKFADFDLDGLQDIFLTNGFSRNFTDADVPFSGASLIGQTQFQAYRNADRLLEANQALKNSGDRQFSPAPDWGLGHIGMSLAAATGDLDGDGDPDLVVANLDEEVHLYRNDSTAGGHFSVRFKNRSAIGAKVTLTDSRKIQHTRWLNPQTGFLSQDDSTLLFGLGDSTPTQLDIHWPSGNHQSIDLKDGQKSILLKEAGKKLRPASQKPIFTQIEAPAFKHQERPFDDFAQQPLLPGKLSQFGPCLAATSDLLFVGGASGQSSVIINPPQTLSGKYTESVDAVWFDADNDNDNDTDLDLYVVSGSTEHDPGNIFYRDKLYLNDGKGILTDAPIGSLPDLRDSGSCVAAADYDADGDIDLFVGTRSIVGKYPLSPNSRLLQNDGKGKFTEAETMNIGMVTDAVWADIDNDKDPDLCLTTEWGPVRIFKNTAGKLTESPDTHDHTGWWKCIAAADIDQDGDIDLITGNVGHNTKYGKKIARLYYGDMDGSGKSNIIEAKFAEDKLLPIRGKSCSTHAMPGLAKEFDTYRKFASQDLIGIYTAPRVEAAQKFTANTLASGVWINTSGHFHFTPFPSAAQLSPVNAIATGDFNGNGKTEILLAQNHDTREPETGLWRGTPGTHLEWSDTGLQVIPHAQSGLILPADTKAIITLKQNQVLAGQNNGPLLLFSIKAH
jgi:hypothetical protein